MKNINVSDVREFIHLHPTLMSYCIGTVALLALLHLFLKRKEWAIREEANLRAGSTQANQYKDNNGALSAKDRLIHPKVKIYRVSSINIYSYPTEIWIKPVAGVNLNVPEMCKAIGRIYHERDWYDSKDDHGFTVFKNRARL